jgi:hypothetical protein
LKGEVVRETAIDVFPAFLGIWFLERKMDGMDVVVLVLKPPKV